MNETGKQAREIKWHGILLRSRRWLGLFKRPLMLSAGRVGVSDTLRDVASGVHAVTSGAWRNSHNVNDRRVLSSRYIIVIVELRMASEC